MNKKDYYFPFLFTILTLLFALVSFAVFLSKGKSNFLIAQKFKFGGLLLTFSSVTDNIGGGEIMCYSSAAEDSIWIDTNLPINIEINLSKNDVLIGGIMGYLNSDFSFALLNSDNIKVQCDNIFPVNEKFKIKLNKNLKSGEYLLNLFSTNLAKQDKISPRNNYKLIVKDD